MCADSELWCIISESLNKKPRLNIHFGKQEMEQFNFSGDSKKQYIKKWNWKIIKVKIKEYRVIKKISCKPGSIAHGMSS